MLKLIELEWKKLERKKVIGEAITYWLILMFLPIFFLKVVFADMPIVRFGESYAAALDLMIAIQMGFILFGASLINHVFIEEYKNKTIALSFGYPFSRKRLVMAKVLFIVLAVFIGTLVSFGVSGIATFALNQVMDVIPGTPTAADLTNYVIRMIIHSFAAALASLIPLFLFGIWKRAVIPTVICAVFLMQFPNFLGLLRITLSPDFLYIIFSILGVLSVILSVKFVNKLGDM
ncbi:MULTISPECIES: ABC transporter permease [Paenibacillus]|uniref:YcbO protein n=1 Tax=Paenibacillus illinoisensis TaxID=59845 RepID=A0A2W0C5K7_9BACL|nr:MULTISPECIES: ABC transporter permease [Paenibacillus]PAD29910.1 ABC transporter permease [Paenibacillus sp. 7523-1]PYY27546.1 YcbO protein [Paenibacillus illinoisensis]